jgi:hypothetical protein
VSDVQRETRKVEVGALTRLLDSSTTYLVMACIYWHITKGVDNGRFS